MTKLRCFMPEILAYPTTLHYTTNFRRESRAMAKRMRNVRLIMANGETRMIQVKTTTERYIREIIADLWLPAKVTGWEVL